MSSRMKTTNRSVANERLQRITLRHLPSMVRKKASQATVQEEFDRWESIIASLPMTSDEYSKAENDLTAAWNYWETGELGAASYQLTQLARRLRNTFAEQFGAACAVKI